MNFKPLPFLSPEDIERFWSKVDRKGPDDCWLWTAYKTKPGYGKFGVGCIVYIATRIAYAVGHGKDPGHKLVCHKCDNPPCVNPAHLFLGNHADNSNDCKQKGRPMGKPKGTPSLHSRKFSEVDVLDIRDAYSIGITQTELARRYKVYQGTISAIVRGLAYPELPGVSKPAFFRKK